MNRTLGIALAVSASAALAVAVGPAAQALPEPGSYTTINYSGAVPGSSTLPTGIRTTGSVDPSQVYISGVYRASNSSGGTQGLLYKGDLLGGGTQMLLNRPSTSGATTTNTSLYGPDNVSNTGVRVVGSYKTSQTGSMSHGLIYRNPAGLPAVGTWATIDATPLVASGDTLLNTIAHSTRGGLVVGNFDTKLEEGRAFVTNVTGKSWFEITKPGALSITAYGVWSNGGSSFTICGGYFSPPVGTAAPVEHGYLVQYNSTTRALTGWRSFNFGNWKSANLVTHFDGITPDGSGGFNLTGVRIGPGALTGQAFFANVPVTAGVFGTASWTGFTYPNSLLTTGNSVYQDTIIGVYKGPGQAGVSGFAARLGVK